MPTTRAKVFTPGDIFQGPADVYLGVQAPASAVPPVQYINTLQLDASGQPPDAGASGIHLGLTEGPASISSTPKFDEIKSDQFAAAVDAAFVSLATEIDFIVKELSLAHIQRYFAGILTGTYTNVVAGGTNPAADFLQVGSNKNSQMQGLTTLLLIAPRRNVASKWLYVMAYKAYLASAIALPVDRKKETSIKMKWKCVADTSRAASDQVLQIVGMT